jgi:hypothetical protein
MMLSVISNTTCQVFWNWNIRMPKGMSCIYAKEETEGKRPRGQEEFMAVFNFVVGLLCCRRGIRISLWMIEAT